MKTIAAQTLSSLDDTGTGLSLLFEWRGDRWKHAIVLLENGEQTGSLCSVEGDIHSDWPQSAPFQQLSIEEASPQRSVAFLVGMAGKSHWSGSVEALPEERALVFDIACRAHEITPAFLPFLGSTYTSDLPLQLQADTCELMRSPVAKGPLGKWVFSLADLPSSESQMLCADEAILVCQPLLCGVEKASKQSPGRAATVRWKYRIACNY